MRKQLFLILSGVVLYAIFQTAAVHAQIKTKNDCDPAPEIQKKLLIEDQKFKALDELKSNIKQPRGITGRATFRVEKKFCRNVGNALIKSTLPFHPNPWKRSHAIYSLMAMDLDQSVIADILEESIKHPVNQQYLPEELAYRRRVENTLPNGKGFFGPLGDYPALEEMDVVNAISAAATLLDTSDADHILGMFRPYLHKYFYLGADDGLIALIAHSSLQNDIALDALSWTEKGAPVYKGAAYKLLLTIDNPSNGLRAEINRRCSASKGLWGSSTEQEQYRCNVILAHWGDKNAFKKVEERLYQHKHTQGTSDDLLINLPGDGYPILMKALFSSDLAVATKAAVMLCHLGPDLGKKGIERVKFLAPRFSDPDAGQRVLAWCLADSRTELGSFVQLPDAKNGN